MAELCAKRRHVFRVSDLTADVKERLETLVENSQLLQKQTKSKWLCYYEDLKGKPTGKRCS